jgi:DNA-binding NarL/FixJ family response regulator
MGDMPARLSQLNRILADIDRQTAEAEVELLRTLSDEELRRIIETLADLQLLKQQVEAKIKQREQLQEGIQALSGRELEVFTLLGGGLTSPQIAERLALATSTVETYRERLKDKLELKTGAELNRAAILWIQRQGSDQSFAH